MGKDRQPSRVEYGEYQVHLLSEVEKFIRIRHIPPTRFGREAVGDPRFVFDLRRGREPRPATVRRVCKFLETSR